MTFLKAGGKSVAHLGHGPRVHDSHVPPAFAEYKYHFFTLTDRACGKTSKALRDVIGIKTSRLPWTGIKQQHYHDTASEYQRDIIFFHSI